MTGRVLGIDPSLTATGIASSAGWTVTRGTDGHRADTYPQRQRRIHQVFTDVASLMQLPVELVVMEGPAYSRGADPSAFDRAGLWWRIYRMCYIARVPVAVATPGQLKLYATGKGNAAKGAVIDAVARRWPQFDTGGNDNACDAVVLLAMGLDHLGTPLCDMPVTHRRALGSVAWPDTGDPQ